MCMENFQQSDFENERNIFKPEMESITPGVRSVCSGLQYLLYVVYTLHAWKIIYLFDNPNNQGSDCIVFLIY